MSVKELINEQISSNPIILYMKGSPEAPQCGFSAKSSQAISACGIPFATVDVLQNPDIRRELPAHSNWPTFPQLYLNGELIGGCDIILELYESGELQKLITEADASIKT
jgi:monothiol glutaredoxin